MDQQSFLQQMYSAAVTAKHPWPEYAACEAAIDSWWDVGKLIATANNPFGFRTPSKVAPGSTSIVVANNRVWNGKMTVASASFLKYNTLADAFTERMKRMKQLRSTYYGALNADSGEEFVMQVSARWTEVDGTSTRNNGVSLIFNFMGKNYLWNQGRWSGNPARASNVIALYEANKAVFA